MFSLNLNTTWFIQFIRALCRYTFLVLFLGYLVAYTFEQLFPGSILRTAQFSNIPPILIVLGICVLLFPRENLFISVPRPGMLRSVIAIGSVIAAFAIVRNLNVQPWIAVLLFSVTVFTFWFFLCDIFVPLPTERKHFDT